MTGERPHTSRGSTLRVLAGAVCLVVGVALSMIGFVRLVMVLDRGGYGTSGVSMALVILGLAGACLAAGIATIIWDVAKRYEQR